jgi:hypothetical protein
MIEMPADRSPCEEERCPINEELLGALYRTDKNGIPALLATLTPYDRASLALFCYPRAHLHELGITIAASCEESDLVSIGGRVGTILHSISRSAPQAAPSPTHAVERRRITLATGQLRQMLPLDDEPDDTPSLDLAFAGATP